MTTPTLQGGLLSPSEVGDVNRSRVLQAFCDHGPLSRADLAKMAGTTRATIGNIVQNLLDGGLVEEGEPQLEGRVGKPARPLWFTRSAGLSAVAVVGAGTLEAALVNARGDVLAHRTATFNAIDRSGTAVRIAVLDALSATIDTADGPLLGIGIAIPGICDPEAGRIIGSGQVPGLPQSGLVEAITARWALPVVVDNDSRAQALGEKWFGDGRGVTTYASVQTGHGLGVGLVIGGAVYRGDDGQNGELGHTCVMAVDGVRCRCGLTGCWETVATLGWLRGAAAERGLRGATRIDAARLVAQAASDPAAADLLAQYADHLAIGLANLVQVFGPPLVILHGDAVRGGEAFRLAIEQATKQRVLAPRRDRLQIVLSKLDQQATLLGAAGLVLSEAFRLAT